MNNRRLELSKTHRYVLIGTVVIGLVVKLLLFDFQYVDYGFYLSRWIGEIKANGYLNALSKPFYNYTPLYMYFLTLVAWLDVNSLYAIKLVSVAFDYLLAFYVGRLAYLYWKSKKTLLIAFAVVPLIPTILLNSAFMSQCDALYATFAVGSVYYLFTARRWTAMAFLSIAFALKIQTAVILPFYFVYMLRGNIKWNYFLVLPIAYLISIIPTWIVGRPLVDLLTIYFSQASYNTELVKNFPNIYVWIGQFGDIAKYVGLFIVLALTLAAGFVLRKKEYKFTYDSWMRLLLLSAIICPFFLPGMLERYMYIGDVMATLLVIINLKKYILPAAGVVFISLYSYVRSIYMFSFSGDAMYPSTPFSIFEYIPWQAVSILYVVVIAYWLYDFYKATKVKIETKEEEKEEVAQEASFAD